MPDVAREFQERLGVALERYQELSQADGFYGSHGRAGLKSIDEFTRGVQGLTKELEQVPEAIREQAREFCVPCFDVGLRLFEVHQAALQLMKGLRR